MSAELEELIVAASNGDDESVNKLAQKVKTAEAADIKAAAENFDFLFDAWDDADMPSQPKAKLVLELADRDVFESTSFRTALNEAVRATLPPYLFSQGVLKALGARDTAVQPHEVASRLKKIQHVKNGALLTQNDSKVWSKILSIEKVTASFSITAITGGANNSLPIASAVSSALFFNAHPDMYNMLAPNKRNLASSAAYRRTFLANALCDISDAKLRSTIQRLLVPDVLSSDEFEAWWTSEAKPAAASGKREAWQARSILELNTFIAQYAEKGGIKFDEAQATTLSKLFKSIKLTMSDKDFSMLAECIGIIAEANGEDILGILFEGLRGRTPFFPASVDGLAISKKLEVWGHVNMKLLPAFVKAAKVLYTPEELAKLACRLPLRSLGPVIDAIGDLKVMASAVFADKALTSDMLMYIWRTRASLPKNLVSIVDMDHIANAISMMNLPKEWTSAQRDLKRSLFEKAEFQKFVIGNADGDMISIIDALQKVRTFQHGECQSLLVKLSRHSEELLNLIESGEGNHLMGEGETESVAIDVTLTSRASLSRIANELEDLINVQMPENVKAIAHARSYGDLSENAEYDAAKERKRFLIGRRKELESTLNSIHSTLFKDITAGNKVILGSKVTLTGADGAEVVYYILGALDGDPDNNRISYRTKMGEALLNATVGDKVKLPDGEKTVKSISALPADMVKQLDEEA